MFDHDLLSRAAALAFRLHAGQYRKGTAIPYVAHLMAVAALVLEHGGDAEQAAAALLHDAIEDCGVAHALTITTQFGPRVAAIVRACTDTGTTPEAGWHARKEAYLARLDTAPRDALLVSACDKLHNARALVADLRAHGPVTLDRFNGGAEGTVWYYGALAAAFDRLLGRTRLARELAIEAAEMRRQAGGIAPT